MLLHIFFRKQLSIKLTDGETEANTHTQPHPQHNSALIQHVPLYNALVITTLPLIPHRNASVTVMDGQHVSY